MSTVVLWTAVTVVVYLLAQRVASAAGDTPLLQPVVVTTLSLIGLLLWSKVPYAVYARSTAGITFLLVPATIAIAVPIYREVRAIERNAKAILAALLAGSATAIVSAVVIAHLFGCDATLLRSLAPKSVTTPVAMAISAQIGGIPALSAIFAIASGVVGAFVAPLALRIWSERATGLAVGTTAHGVGTARLYRLSHTAAAFSGVAMGLNAIASAILLPPIVALLRPLLGGS